MAVTDRKAEVKSVIGSANDRRCGPCEVDTEHKEAHGYCMDCMDYLCIDCYRSHSKSRASRQHTLRKIAELSTADVAQSQTNTCNETCKKHTREYIKFFCSEHKVLGCSDCIILNHRTCHLEYIPEESVGFSDSVELKDTECALEKELEEMTTCMIKVNIVESITEDIHEKCMKDIDDFQTKMILRLNTLRSQIKVQADTKKKKSNADIERVKSTIDQMTTALKQAGTDIQIFKAARQDGQLFISTKRAQSVVQSNKKKARNISITAGEIMYQFERGHSLEKILEESNTFGKLKTTECFEAIEPVSNGVVVLNVPKDATYDDVKMYFENKKESHGGETEKLDVHAEERFGMVWFKDPKAVSSVCLKKEHALCGRNVQALSYIEYLALSHSSFELDQTLDKITFLKELESERSSIERELSKCNAEMLWKEHPLRVQCKLRKDEWCQRNLLRSWKTEAYEVLERLTEKPLVKVITVSGANWKNALDALKTVTIADPGTLYILSTRSTCQIALICLDGYKESDLNTVLDELKDF